MWPNVVIKFQKFKLSRCEPCKFHSKNFFKVKTGAFNDGSFNLTSDNASYIAPSAHFGAAFL